MEILGKQGPEAPRNDSERIQATIAFLKLESEVLQKEKNRLCINTDGTDPRFAIKRRPDYVPQLEALLVRVKEVRAKANNILGADLMTKWGEDDNPDANPEFRALGDAYWLLPFEEDITSQMRMTERDLNR